MNRVDEIESAEESEISYKENLQNQYLFAMPMSFLSGMGHGLCLISNSWWLKSLGFSYKNITLFILVNISFGLKFLWIPIFDKIDFTKFARRFFSLKFSIQRKFPMVICIYLSSFFIFLATFFSPLANIYRFSACIFLGAFWLANGEVIMMAYNLETLRPKNMGITTAAYRMGHFMGSWTLIFLNESYNISWSTMFRIVSILMSIIASLGFLAPTEKNHKMKTWSESLFDPYFDLANKYKMNLVFIVLFIILYKARDRICDPVNNLFIRDNSGLNSYTFFGLKFFSTFLLAASAIGSGSIIERYNYKKSFLISIMMNFLNILAYFTYTFRNKFGYFFCMLFSCSSYFLLWHLIQQKESHQKIRKKFRLSRIFIFFSLCVICFLFVAIVFFQKFSHLVFSLPTMSIFLLVFSDKVTSGLKASVLYSYQTSLCSRKYALSQTTIMTSLELFTSYLFLQPFSGSFVDYLGWNRFYLISTLITLLPLLMQWTIVDKKSVGG